MASTIEKLTFTADGPVPDIGGRKGKCTASECVEMEQNIYLGAMLSFAGVEIESPDTPTAIKVLASV